MTNIYETLVTKALDTKWFSNAGVHDLPNCEYTVSWKKAIENLDDADRIEASTQSRNILHQNVLDDFIKQRGFKEGHSAWDAFTSKHDSIYEAAEDQAELYADSTQFNKALKRLKLPSEVKDIFIDDVQLIIAFREIFGECTHFYAEEFEIFLKGHFPCGYVGEYPKGKFIIY